MRTDWPPSLWAHTAPPPPTCEVLQDDTETDFCVIGGGFTGLSTALHLAKLGHQVTVLESQEPGYGASGRNGGQVNPGWYINPEDIRRLYGEKTGNSVLQMVDGACDLVFNLIKENNIDCEAIRSGFIQGVRGKHGIPIIHTKIRQWQQFGSPTRLVEHDEITKLLGTPVYHCAMLDERGGNLQPLSYARGLARAAQQLGVKIFQHARVTRVTPDAGQWCIHVDNHKVRARRLAFCTNGYTDNAWHRLKRSIVPTATVIAATQPLPEEMLEHILPHRHAVAETARMFYYYKRDGNGRFLIGCKGPTFRAPDADPALNARQAAVQFFPMLKDVKWEFGWGGYIALTPDARPRLMRLAEGVFAGMGYYGRGVAMATAMGKELATHLADQSGQMPVTPLKQITLHEFYKIGVFARVMGFKIMDRLAPT